MIQTFAGADAAAVRLLETDDGRLDTQLRSASGTWVRLHSLHAPESEASDLIDRALEGRSLPPIVAVVGIGLGYVVDELERRRPDVRILALELVPGLVDFWRRRRDWSEGLRSGRIVVGQDPDYELSNPAWPAAALGEPPLVLVHPVLGQHLPLAVERARKVLSQFLFEQRANAEARLRLSGIYLRHTLDNLPALGGATDVSALEGVAVGAPLVLCGAGPSLGRLLPDLQALRDRAWVVALDTALRPLLEAGIVPDLVVTIDPTPLNGRHLLNLPTRKRPWLVAETSVDPRVLAAFGGRTFACRIGRAEPWPWLETLGIACTRLDVWGSVLTAGCDLASRMRASLVIFAGVDLAFTDGQPYCRGTTFEEDWRAQQLRDGLFSIESVWQARIAAEQTIQEPDVNSRLTRTAPHMVAFRNWVRTFAAANSDRAFVNASGAGILHGPEIVQADLRTALGRSRALDGGSRALAGAARPSFARRLPALRAGIDEVAGSGDASRVLRDWAEAVPDFNEADIAHRLRCASSRLGHRKGATIIMAESDWIDVPYDATNFLAKPPLHWSVDESSVATYAYRVQGKTMTLAFTINHSTLEGGPSNELCLRIPAGHLPARGMANPIWLCSHSGKECGYATVHPGLDVVVLFRASEEYFPIEHGDFFVFGQLTFEVQ